MGSDSAFTGQYSSPRTTADQWGPAWLVCPPAEPPQAQAAAAVASEVNTDVDSCSRLPPVLEWSAQQANNPFVASSEFVAYSETCWNDLYRHDYRYLTGRRNLPNPCPWCGRRLTHDPLCDELRASWQPVMPFGKHKGKPLPDVPRDYLEWLGGTVGIATDLRDAIRLLLKSSSAFEETNRAAH